jgi:hypothetical protein
MRRCRWGVTILVLLFPLVIAAQHLCVGALDPPSYQVAVAAPVVLWRGEGASSLQILPPPRPAGMHVQGADYTVDWLEGRSNAWGYACGAWPSEAKAAVHYALSIWAAEVQSPVSMAIEACWTPLEGSVLGAGGPAVFVRDFAGAPRSETWYPVALANALAGEDLNGTGPGSHELNLVINGAFAGWYYGLDGVVPYSRHDLVTAVLHELCHGLGFISSMNAAGSVGTWGLGSSTYPVILDHFLQNGTGQKLLSFTNGSTALRDQLLGRGGGVYFSGARTNAANGGVPVRMYSPSTWQPGSSISHLDAQYQGGPNALMTTTLWNGQAVHDPGPLTRGIMHDIGVLASLPDLAVSSAVLGADQLKPGDTVNLLVEVSNVGGGTASSVVLAETLAPEMGYLSSQSSPSLGGGSPVSPEPGTWVWYLPDMPPGAHGTITISARLDPDLEPGFALWATASVSAAEQELTLANSVARTLVGGTRCYFPVLINSAD